MACNIQKLVISLICSVVIGLGADFAVAQNRFALVVGNADYQVGKLANPVNDAEDMTTILKRMGFETILVKNANRSQMRNAIREFGKNIQSRAGC